MRRPRRNMVLFAGLVCTASIAASCDGHAAPPERPTLNHTADPRPNILPNGLYNFWTPYRLQKNRPTNVIGHAAYYFAPQSQEAMVWAENHAQGHYHPHHQPAYFKQYYYPKPWEALTVGPRPDHQHHGGMQQSPADGETVPATPAGAE